VKCEWMFARCSTDFRLLKSKVRLSHVLNCNKFTVCIPFINILNVCYDQQIEINFAAVINIVELLSTYMMRRTLV